MAYQSTIEVTCWKEHACSFCGSQYRYRLKRAQTAQGGTPEQAEENVRISIINTIEQQVDLQPCPKCGKYQPDMVATRQSFWSMWAFWIFLSILVVVGILSIVGTMSDMVFLTLTAAISGVLAVVFLILAGRNLNSNPDANLATADREVKKDNLQLMLAGQEDNDPGIYSTPGLLAFGLIAVAVFAIPLAEFARMAAGWPVNSGWQPQIVSPGDHTWTNFQTISVRAVKGMWTANFQSAQVMNASDVGLDHAQLKTEARNDKWGDDIRISSKETKESSITPWCRIYLPDNPKIVGKKLKINMQLRVFFPEMMANNTFNNSERTESHTGYLVVAPVGAGSNYRMLRIAGVVVGLGLITLLFFVLWRRAKHNVALAQPTRVYSIDEEPLEPPAQE